LSAEPRTEQRTLDDRSPAPRRALILTSRFPPFDTPAARRALGLYRHLPACGWETHVVTADPARIWNPFGLRPTDRCAFDPSWVRRTDFALSWHLANRLGYRSLQAAAALINSPTLQRGAELFRFPDAELPWLPYAVAEALRLARAHPIDAIISTAPPPTTHLAARALKALLGEAPLWLADFRDPWSQETTRVCGDPPWRLDARLEASVLRGADGLSAVSHSWADGLDKLGLGLPVATIINGFDPDDYRHLRAAPRADKMLISYAGIAYPGLRDPVPMARAVARLLADRALPRERIEVRCYGLHDPALDRAIAELGLADVMRIESRMPRHQVLERLAESAVLWNMGFSQLSDPGNIPSKVFEYMGCRRPVLSTGGRAGDDLDQLLASTGAGERVDADEQSIATAILALFERFDAQGPQACVVPEEAAAPFTHRAMAGRFAAVLEGLRPQHTR